ncbi:hypothetical protein K1719_035483 [Acacia pycnantha]|nr:hypothetical protein K1719_035483 [Acacia pycnantha]
MVIWLELAFRRGGQIDIVELRIMDLVHVARNYLEGENLKKIISLSRVEILLYAPVRPLIDYFVAFLCLMAVGTVALASLWSDYSVPWLSQQGPAMVMS